MKKKDTHRCSYCDKQLDNEADFKVIDSFIICHKCFINYHEGKEGRRCLRRVVHVLKIRWQYLHNINNGRKNFEVRYNDRDYQVGDIIAFVDENGESFKRIDLKTTYKIKYIHTGMGMCLNFVVLGIESAE